ncbi:MAG TPA: DUF1328 domain-containing protein [Phycisphaerae bacterium]|nr:DUF1328 domain-containing protein [Phycisphaerales bacterium]HRX86028.1 DUF1328 domain-containing protein [Phycisphaerae bacterium]
MGLLGWAILCFILAVISGLLGFTGIAAGFMVVARVLFAIFLIGFLILVVLLILGIGIAAG